MSNIERKTKKGAKRVFAFIVGLTAPIFSVILIVVGLILSFVGYNNEVINRGLVDGGIALIIVAYFTFALTFISIAYLFISYNPITVNKNSTIQNATVQKIISRLWALLFAAGIVFLINLGFTLFFVFLSAGEFSFNIQFSNGTNPFLNYQQEIEVYFYGVFAVFIAFQLFMGSWIGHIIIKLYKAATYKAYRSEKE